MLRLNKLTKTYKTGDQALKAVDLEVPEGQVLALIGPSGAGKSTLIRCINRLEEHQKGDIVVDGRQLRKRVEKDDIVVVLRRFLTTGYVR